MITKYSVVGYVDDVKPAISSLEELAMIDGAAATFEGASGCKLHCDSNTDKCKILLLGRWRQELS